MRNMMIVGAGGHARPVIAATKLLGKWVLSGVIDLAFQGQIEAILDVPVVGGVEVVKACNPSLMDVFIAIGCNKERSGVYVDLSKKGYALPNIVHPTAYVDKSVQLGQGNYIGPFAHVGPNVCIGDANIVNTCANLEHEVHVGNFSQFAPNSVVCGRTKIGSNVFVGASATIIERLTVSDLTLIGAGSVIVNDILIPNQRFLGVPGRCV